MSMDNYERRMTLVHKITNARTLDELVELESKIKEVGGTAGYIDTLINTQLDKLAKGM